MRELVREVLCPVMWAELASIGIFLGGMLTIAALLSGV